MDALRKMINNLFKESLYGEKKINVLIAFFSFLIKMTFLK